jgi:hypothetical protein
LVICAISILWAKSICPTVTLPGRSGIKRL